MAIWMHAWGRNGLGAYNSTRNNEYLSLISSVTVDKLAVIESLSLPGSQNVLSTSKIKELEAIQYNYLSGMTNAGYREYLQSMQLPYLEIDALIEHWRKQGEDRQADKERQLTLAHERILTGKNQSKWALAGSSDTWARFTNNIVDADDDYSGLSVHLFNDLIQLAGPFDIMSSYARFTTLPPDILDRYRTMFKNILTAFKSDYILYAHEWSGIYLDDENDLVSGELLSRLSPERRSPSIAEIGTNYSYYFEPI